MHASDIRGIQRFVAVFGAKVVTLLRIAIRRSLRLYPHSSLSRVTLKRLHMLAWADTVLISGLLVVMFGFGLMVSATAGVGMWTQLNRRASAGHSTSARHHRIALLLRSKLRDWTR